jgi:hypothetical protein
VAQVRHSTPQRRNRNAAEAEAVATLRMYVDGCEFCRRDVATEPHHLASGCNKAASVGDVSLLVMLCRPCHDTIEAMRSVDERACGLAIAYHAGRLNLEHFYRVTGRRYPDWRDVELWVKRITGA